MKISVITVCFNNATTLEQSLHSVSAQDWPHVEHIVIDGYSTDGSMTIIERYRHQLAHVISEPDNGIYDAMNKGLDLARGDIICFLNADDRYSHSQVLSQVALQMDNQQLDAVTGDVGFFRKQNPMRIIRRYSSKRFRPSLLSWGWMPPHPALFLSRSVVERVGHFKTYYKIAGDFEYIIRAFHGQNLRYQHRPEVLVLMQTGGVSTNGWRSKILLNREVMCACRENGLKTNMLKILSKYPRKLLEFLITQ